MKVSYNWLKEYVNIGVSTDSLAGILTNCGLEVEAVEHTGVEKTRLDGVVVGYVAEKAKHPNADKLSLTKVDIGSGNLLSIVCGASNVEAGQKVLVATIGTKIITSKGEYVIQKSTIRGEVSEGMICAEDELGLTDSHAGIMVLDKDAPIGMDAFSYLKPEQDVIFEIGLTPNRSDAASHIGVARDIVACLNIQNQNLLSLKLPDVSEFLIDNKDFIIDIEVRDTKACPRYSGITISGITVEDSPQWLQNRLNSIGIRPINNIVDITNFVLFELGQPLHAFDADKISGRKVVVKQMPDQTKFVTLDGVERLLTTNDLMICSDTGPMCIAGVFGGEHSGITENTTRVFLESAYFNPSSVRKTSKYHGLKTDASFRFERGCNPDITVYALKRAALLIKQIAGGTVSSDIVDIYPSKIEETVINFSLNNLNEIVGKKIELSVVKNILSSLEFKILSDENGVLKLQIPLFKTDVLREIDVVEEVLRIYGYNNIEFGEGMKMAVNNFPKPDVEKIQNVISDYLTSLGLYEVLNNSLTGLQYYEKNADIFDPLRCVRILNPLSKELNVMRQSLLFGGLESILFNKNHKNYNTLFFEFGKVYQVDSSKKESVLDKYIETKHLGIFLSGNICEADWHQPEKKADLFYLKSLASRILSRTGIVERKLSIMKNQNTMMFEESLTYYSEHLILCELGEVNHKLLQQFDIKDRVFFAFINWNLLMSLTADVKTEYSEICKFPEVTRDLSLLLPSAVSFDELKNVAFETSTLIKSVSLFDIYEGKNIEQGSKSYALNFILQDEEKTLTDLEIETCMNAIIKIFKDKFGAKLR